MRGHRNIPMSGQKLPMTAHNLTWAITTQQPFLFPSNSVHIDYRCKKNSHGGTDTLWGPGFQFLKMTFVSGHKKWPLTTPNIDIKIPTCWYHFVYVWRVLWSIIKCPMIDQGGLWVIILLSFDVPSIIYLSLYIQEQNLKVIPAYDRSYNSYEQSEAKIFIIWAIIKCHMINQSILWVIVLLSFDVPPIIYLLLYIHEQKS